MNGQHGVKYKEFFMEDRVKKLEATVARMTIRLEAAEGYIEAVSSGVPLAEALAGAHRLIAQLRDRDSVVKEGPCPPQ